MKTKRPMPPPQQSAVHYDVSIKLDMAEMAKWKPERIAAFFSGLAQILATSRKQA